MSANVVALWLMIHAIDAKHVITSYSLTKRFER